MSKGLLLKKLLERNKKEATVLDRLILIILTVGVIMMIAFFVYLLWFALTNRSVTYFLPAQKTVAYFELEDLSLPPQLSQDTVLDMVGLKTVLKKTFDLDTEKLQDYLSQGRLGLALVKENGEENKLLLFFRARNQKQILRFFEGLGLEDEKLAMIENKGNTI